MYRILLIAILILAFLLRVYNVSKNPPSVYGDEITNAWNAYSLLKTGADEFGVPYPLQFRSFGDYKPPLPVYLLIPFIKYLGMNAFSIRLSVIIVSTLTIWATFLLIRHLLDTKTSLLAAFLMAISPWHVHLSRGFFEATLALLPFVLGIYFFTRSKGQWLLIVFSAFSFAVTVYTYFAHRLLAPLMVFFLSALFLREKKFLNKKTLLLFIFTFSLLTMPAVKLSLFDRGAARFERLQMHLGERIAEIVIRERRTSNVPMPWRTYIHNKATVWLREVKNNYLEHFSLNFWFLYGDNSLRYFTGNMGMFYLIELPFFLVGAYVLSTKHKKVALLVWGWLLLAPIPAALVGRSFAVRSIAMLPAPLIFTSYGIKIFWATMKRASWVVSWIILFFIIGGYVVTLGSQLITYHLEYPNYAATWWGWENKTAIEYALKRQDQYDHIFISDFYSGSALAFAFYTRYDPAKYRVAINNTVTIGGRKLIKMGKFYFGSLDIDKQRIEAGIVPPKTLYIARPEEPDGAGTINDPSDDRVLFKIHIFP